MIYSQYCYIISWHNAWFISTTALPSAVQGNKYQQPVTYHYRNPHMVLHFIINFNCKDTLHLNNPGCVSRGNTNKYREENKDSMEMAICLKQWKNMVSVALRTNFIPMSLSNLCVLFHIMRKQSTKEARFLPLPLDSAAIWPFSPQLKHASSKVSQRSTYTGVSWSYTK